MKKNAVIDENVEILCDLKEILSIEILHKAKSELILRLKCINESITKLIKKDDEERSK